MAPAGEATLLDVRHLEESQFQFSPLREGRQEFNCLVRKSSIFQFSPLREGRPTRASSTITSPLFQFSPLREGRRVHHIELRYLLSISILAPA